MKKTKKSEPIISAIVPVYNVCMFLARCIESLINQKYPAVEVILIDDGSTDGSDRICDEYADKYEQIKVIHISNGGVGNARNIGLDMATGEYVTFVDSDDWIEPDFFETGMQKLQSHDADIFICEYKEAYDDGRSRIIDKKIAEALFCTAEAIENTFTWGKNNKSIPWCVGGKIFRATLLKNIRFDTELSMGEDAKALWDIMQGAERVIYTPAALYDYYQRSDSATHALSATHIIDNIRFHKYLIKECENKPQMLKYFKKRLDVVRVSSIIYASRNGEYSDELICETNVFKTHFGRHICSEWELQGCRGLLKIFTACMPDFVIRSVIKMKSYLKID